MTLSKSAVMLVCDVQQFELISDRPRLGSMVIYELFCTLNSICSKLFLNISKIQIFDSTKTGILI